MKFEIDETGKPLSVYFKESKEANKLIEEFMPNKLGEDFGMTTSHFILVHDDLTATEVSDLCDELKDVDGITQVVSLDSITGPGFQTCLLYTSFPGFQLVQTLLGGRGQDALFNGFQKVCESFLRIPELLFQNRQPDVQMVF